MIKNIIDKELRLTTHVCTGRITLDTVLEEIRNFFDLEPTPHTIWDFSGADASEIDPDQIKGVADFTKNYAPDRGPGRTALVTDQDHAYALSRMYEVFSEMAGIHTEVEVFRSLEDAIAWIKNYTAGK